MFVLPKIKPRSAAWIASWLNAPIVPCEGKKCFVKAWPVLKSQETRTPHFLRQFDGKNVGVVLGHNAGDLCVIDCDSDAARDDFLRLNPWAERTLVTRGRRGASFWVKVPMPRPRTTQLRFENDEHWGEFRAE